MEQAILDGLQNLQLTKEEEEDIQVTLQDRADLLDECALSLFGKLQSDRQQNQRALKSTLRAVWKMGSDFRIVEVGNGILQFKFSSQYQMEWVERNGPWNFDNNLLLLCRWKKGLSAANIVFTHSPFWVQVWGLPFELMAEETGRDIGSRIGNYLETDRRSWQMDQAKFMRVRVALQLDKPLCRGGYVTNLEKKRTWVTFKYERLPSVCYGCGKIGHDERHCATPPNDRTAERQYGDWIRADGIHKASQGREKSNKFDSYPSRKESGRPESPLETNGTNDPTANNSDGDQRSRGNQGLENADSVGELGEAELTRNQVVGQSIKWDNSDVDRLEAQKGDVPRNSSFTTLVKGKEKVSMDKSSVVGQQKPKGREEPEVTSPIKPNLNAETEKLVGYLDSNNSKEGKPKTKAWKKLAREQGPNSDMDMADQRIGPGNKRVSSIEPLEIKEKRVSKKTRGEALPSDEQQTEETAVAAGQHRRKQ
ncbi:uncharacterized protein LOC115994718 [Quercus lobata]|uniref:uncharacterized protein LOC115994718 n=1 Tax=Quercus lobata TaxID=97700 RepID=UPI0012447C8E|nr:uncharacterized protein LOC115994718 [Quercus lobata]